jgi:hypothetical protein
MARQFSENGIFCRKFPVFEKKIRQKATEKLVSWGWCSSFKASYSFISKLFRNWIYTELGLQFF